MRSSTSFLTFVILALQLSVYAVPIQERGASDAVGVAISAPPTTGSEYDPEQKRAFFSSGTKTPAAPIAKPAAPVVPPPVKPAAPVVVPPVKPAAPVVVPPVKPAAPVVPPVKPAAPAESPVKPAAPVLPPIAPPVGIPPVAPVPPVVPAKTSSTSSSSAASETDVACVAGTTVAKGTKRRRCFGAKNIEGGTELVTPPPLEPNQIRLTDTSSRALRVGTVGTQLGKAGSTAEAFNAEWPGANGQQVAKRFFPGKSAVAETGNLRAVRRLTAFGKSTLGPSGTAFDWVVSPFVPGVPLTETPDFKSAVKLPEDQCRAFLTKTCDLLVQAVEAIEATSQRVLDDLSDANIHWENIAGNQPPGLFDFGQMFTQATKPTLLARFQAKDTAGYVRRRCVQLWNPGSLCTVKAAASGSDSRAAASSSKGGQ